MERSERTVLENKYQIKVHLTSETWIHIMKFSIFFTMTRTEESERAVPEMVSLMGTVALYSATVPIKKNIHQIKMNESCRQQIGLQVRMRCSWQHNHV